MKADDKRIAHLEKISLENSRVDLSSPIIFLCGGLVDIKKTPSPSIRDSFLRYIHKSDDILSNNIILAEDFKDWIHDSVYKDLLDFESDIAHISSVIVIILESPGALAELGLFVRNRVLNKKLIIFVNDSHYDTDSFIKLGPLRYLETIKEKTVCAYPWDLENIDSSIKESLPEMKQDLTQKISDTDKTEAFDATNDGHLSFVLYEFIRVFQALKLTEIELYTRKVGLELSRDKVKRLLFLLSKFELIRFGKRGNDGYYYALVNIEKVHFGGHFDKRDAKISTMQFYMLNESESRRVNFIKRIVKAEKKQGEAA